LLLLGVSAWFLHNYVEKRLKAANFGLKNVAVLAILLAVLMPFTKFLKNQSYSMLEKNISSAYFDRSPYRCGKTFRILNPTKLICKITPLGSSGKVLLLGNSHADSIKTIFASEAQRLDVTSYFWVQNDPLMGTNPRISEVVNSAIENGIKVVFFHYSAGAVEEKILNEVIKELDSSRIKTVILGPVPTWKYQVPERMWEYRQSGFNLDLSQSYSQFLDLNSQALTELNDIVLKNNVPYFDLASKLCTVKCRYASIEGRPYYWDAGHLTLAGAKELGPVLAEALRLGVSD
jgi:hypothetical protein